MGFLPFAIEFYLVPVCRFRLQIFYRNLVGVIGYAADYRTILAGAVEGYGVFHCLIVGDADLRAVGFFLGVPAEIQLRGVGAGSNGYLFVIGLNGIPIVFPLLPIRIF
ncbi:Uncharacterised protein [uncultured Ruminococcus sp.]|nr:Uncharacterised protein [uncultured Ruminococcus sp.]